MDPKKILTYGLIGIAIAVLGLIANTLIFGAAGMIAPPLQTGEDLAGIGAIMIVAYAISLVVAGMIAVYVVKKIRV